MSEATDQAFQEVLKRSQFANAEQATSETALPLPSASPPDDRSQEWMERMRRELSEKPLVKEVTMPDGSTKTLYLKANGKYGPHGPNATKQNNPKFAEAARKNGEKRQINLTTDEEKAELAATLAKAIINPKTRTKAAIIANPHLQHITPTDRMRVAKLAGEEFNKLLSDRLAELTDLTVEEIKRNLIDGSFKTGELPFALNVIEQRRAQLDGRSSIANAQINVQVNNYGGASKEDIIAQLTNVTPQVPSAPQPEEVVEAEPEQP